VNVVVRRIVGVVLVGLVLIAVAVGVWRGITEPNGTLWGASNRTLDVLACWVLFLFLPLACAIDAMLIAEVDWWAARRSRAAWIALLAYAPVLGPLAYAALGRPPARTG